MREAIDLYFHENGNLIHMHVGDHSNWEYKNELIL